MECCKDYDPEMISRTF